MHELIATADGQMDVYIATPAGAPKGGIVVIQEAFGITTHIESVCDLLAADGWVAVAPALFTIGGAFLLASLEAGFALLAAASLAAIIAGLLFAWVALVEILR